MDCRAALAMTGSLPRFVIANEVRRSIVEKTGAWIAALCSQCRGSPRFVIANEVRRSIVEQAQSWIATLCLQ